MDVRPRRVAVARMISPKKPEKIRVASVSMIIIIIDIFE